MTHLQQIQHILKQEKDTLAQEYHVARIGIFGSVVRGEDTQKSDIDILVDFSEPIGLLKFARMERHLAEKLQRNVDLVSRTALKPNIGERIMKEVRYVS